MPIKEIWDLIFEPIDINKISNRKFKRIKWRKSKIKQKFNKIRKNKIFRDIVLNTKSDYVEPEWGIPKGRKKYKLEPDIQIAKREFEEETGYANYVMINTCKFTESYISSNNIRYNNIYYLALMDSNLCKPHVDPNNIYQKYEISKIKWIPIKNAHKYIRTTYKSKLNCIKELKNMFNKPRLNNPSQV